MTLVTLLIKARVCKLLFGVHSNGELCCTQLGTQFAIQVMAHLHSVSTSDPLEQEQVSVADGLHCNLVAVCVVWAN